MPDCPGFKDGYVKGVKLTGGLAAEPFQIVEPNLTLFNPPLLAGQLLIDPPVIVTVPPVLLVMLKLPFPATDQSQVPAGTGVLVGGTGVLVGMGVLVGGTGVLVGGTGVLVGAGGRVLVGSGIGV